MSDVTTPGDLSPLKQPLIEAVTNAYLRKQWITPEGAVAGDGSEIVVLESIEGSCAEGRFNFRLVHYNPINIEASRNTHLYVSYPDGEWSEDVPFWFDSRADPPFDAEALYAEIVGMVSDWMDPFIDGHSPHEFTNQIDNVSGWIDRLYVQGEVRIGGNPVTPGNDTGTMSVPVSDVQSAIADMASEIGDLSGLAIDALERSYTNDVGLTISGQRAMAMVTGLALAGEAAAWNGVYSDLKTFYANATTDFNSFAESRGASGQGTAQTLSVISGVTAIAAGVTSAFPPAAATLGVVSGLAGLGATLFPQHEAIEPTEIALEGESFYAYWQSFTDCVRAVDTELTNAEACLGAMCDRILADYLDNPDSYSISSRGRNGNGQARDLTDLEQFLNTNANSQDSELYADTAITIVHTKLKNVAGMIESVGDLQRAVAARFNGTDGLGNPSVLVEDEWSRGTLDGKILGAGTSGHFVQLESLVNQLIDLLIAEADTAHRVAEHSIDISTGFALTDQQREEQLNQIAAQFDTVPN